MCINVIPIIVIQVFVIETKKGASSKNLESPCANAQKSKEDLAHTRFGRQKRHGAQPLFWCQQFKN
ncbi:MAG: hypothetical protein IAX21_04535 [Candidatus Bathyarchaeota archaeon]|nr:hypothetical protein [Candidatus Bathyarchaeum tardum]WNZ30123.1 MAG: hypothetical protein IAX21_04535 [Candidatus Bathyarchaeota archaeon]